MVLESESLVDSVPVVIRPTVKTHPPPTGGKKQVGVLPLIPKELSSETREFLRH